MLSCPRRFSKTFSEAVYVVDCDRRITYWNPAAQQLTGFSAAEVVGHHCRDGILNHVNEAGELLCYSGCPLLATMLDGRPTEASLFLHHRDGHRVPVAISAAALRDAEGTLCGAVEAFHDDSPRRSLVDQLDDAESAALADPLTGLANRRMLQRAMYRHQANYRRDGRAFAVLFADIDCFKDINDQYGHDVGDDILQLVAATLRDCSRPSDTVGRWGGDEFQLLAPVSGPEQAHTLSERIRNLVASGWLDIDGRRLAVTMSIGTAMVREHESEARLIERADAAMFTAKANGRNCTVIG